MGQSDPSLNRIFSSFSYQCRKIYPSLQHCQGRPCLHTVWSGVFERNISQPKSWVLFFIFCFRSRQIFIIFQGIQISIKFKFSNHILSFCSNCINHEQVVFPRFFQPKNCLFPMQAAGDSGRGKSQTLPAGSEKKDEPKRRSFFTLKKK